MAYDKLLITDCETTGLDPVKDEIIEIGAILVTHESLETLWEFDLKLAPEHIKTAHPMALQVNGYTPELWADAVPFVPGFNSFLARLDTSMIFTGQNVWFDVGFYLEGLKKVGRKGTDPLDPTPEYSYHRLDIASMAWPFVNPPVYRMSKIAPAFGIEGEVSPHRAINGARKELEILKEIRRRGAEWRWTYEEYRKKCAAP
jgi:DNA polymerase-3 subunit epsilon